jgi:hypothetical protein
LSGNKASVLAQALRESGKTLMEVPQVGNKGLNGKYKIPDRLKLASPLDRRRHRVQLWADDVLQAIAGEDARKPARSSGK